MKPFYSTLIAVIFLVAACSKKDEPAPANNNTNDSTAGTKIFPSLKEHNKDVSWTVHYQGAITADTIDPSKSFFDTGFHFYSTINATDIDTLIGQKTYRVYKSSNHVINKRLNQDQPYYSTYLYVRYDSIKNTLESYYPYYTNAQKSIMLNVGKLAGSTPEFVPGWYKNNCSLVYEPAADILGQKCAALYLVNNGEKYLYQSEITGATSGIVRYPPILLPATSVLRSTTYKYKAYSLQVDFPYRE